MKHADWQLVWAILLILFLAGLGAGFQVGRHRSVLPKPRLPDPAEEPNLRGEGEVTQRPSSTYLWLFPV